MEPLNVWAVIWPFDRLMLPTISNRLNFNRNDSLLMTQFVSWRLGRLIVSIWNDHRWPPNPFHSWKFQFREFNLNDGQFKSWQFLAKTEVLSLTMVSDKCTCKFSETQILNLIWIDTFFTTSMWSSHRCHWRSFQWSSMIRRFNRWN